jgi:hypothetical protein
MKHMFLLCGLFLTAQALSAQKFHAGLLAGGNVSQVDGDNWQGYNKIGFQAGAFTNLSVSPHSSFQLEVEFKQMGSRKNENLQTNDLTSYLLRLNYMEVPVLYQYTFARRFSAELGPAADFLVSYYERQDGLESPNTVPLRPFNVSGLLGAGVWITPHLKADFRFQYSLYSIRQPADPPPPSYRKILFEVGQYNNALVLSLYWDFKKNDIK